MNYKINRDELEDLYYLWITSSHKWVNKRFEEFLEYFNIEEVPMKRLKSQLERATTLNDEATELLNDEATELLNDVKNIKNKFEDNKYTSKVK